MNVNAKLNRAIKLHKEGNFLKAEKLYASVIDADPNNYDALHLMGMLATETGQENRALNLLNKSISIKPDFLLAKMNKGHALIKFGKSQEAISFLNDLKFERSIDPEIFNLCSQAYADMGLYDEAIAELNNYIKLNKNNFQGFYGIGCLYQKKVDFTSAAVYFSKALSIDNSSVSARINLGVSQASLGCIDEAINTFNDCLQIEPRSSAVFTNLGFALKEKDDYAQAIEAFKMAISLNESQCEAYAGLGYTLIAKKMFSEAISYLEKSYHLNPSQDFVLGKILHSKLHICDWEDFNNLYDSVINGIKRGERVATPFTATTICDSPETHKIASGIYTESQRIHFNEFDFNSNNISSSRPINIGYFSADFYNHATSYLIAEVFENHDPEQFHISAFSFSNKSEDEMTRRIKASVKSFFDVSNCRDDEIAQISRKNGIDIAIDLKGYTEGSRPKIFMHKCAPIQINYLGYPGTLASEFYDYIIVDEVIVPNKNKIYFSEKLAYMPSCYQPNDKFRKISNQQLTRNELGLPNESFIFCSFNNNYKIHPRTLDIWCKILKSVKNSCLWVYMDSKYAAENFLKEIAKRDVEPSRIIFAYKISLPDHLARHACADLMLDTFPCCGHTTTSDALWAGLPVLTKMGESFAGRVSASLLVAMELGELIAVSEDDYIKLAIFYANNIDKLTEIREKLSHSRMHSPLFNNVTYTKNLEKLYIKMIEDYVDHTR